ncbi:MAG: DUF2235 domain-containing protein [Rhizobiaceae bacterium]
MKSRNLVILSDGTGNSAAKITKTNIWRIFEAIDLERDDQLAFYDDGVGTGGFKLLRAVGGAFGVGLARNVRQLYEQLCRHYEGKDDNILLFGFSRGAFTARVLSGMIRHCGIIDRGSDETIRVWRWSRLRSEEVPVATDEGLKAAVRVAYRALRKRNDHARLSALYHVVRDGLFRIRTPKTEAFRRQYAVSANQPMKFLGVFDTVSAYGLPVDEMTIAIHKYFLPLRFPDNNLSKRVEHAYQALALDEARHTFHPVLWTEREYRPGGVEGPVDDRPQQAWFAGMHSDVGGGYANDRLSLVPAIWMIEQAMAKGGLKVRRAALDDLRALADAQGEIHDSRRGMGAFYRYKPRILARLGREDLDGNGYAEVQIDRFKIHHAVFDRIKATKADYAPVGIPEDYDVVMPPTPGNANNIASADAAGYEDAGQRRDRMTLQKGIEDTIVRRRAVHLVMLGLALAIALVPFLWLPNPAAVGDGIAAKLAGLLLMAVAYLPVPGAERIGEFWTEHALVFFALAAGFCLSWLVSAKLARVMQAKAQAAWGHLAGRPPHNPTARPQWVDAWRAMWGGAHFWWTKKIMPLLLVVVLFAGVPLLVGWRYAMFKDYGFASVCSAVRQQPEGGQNITFTTRSAAPKTVVFSTKQTCLDTGFEMKEGRYYLITIAVAEPWKDLDFPADPTGLRWSELSWGSRIKMAALSFTRRFWSEDWFAMMGSIGRAREFAFRIDAEPVAGKANTYAWRFKAWRSGTLHLFVNDAITPGRDYYFNNSGTAEITIVEDGEI